ncbi:MAG: hypothetical protein EXQ81_06285 [Thermoleophilia bacterium]|nr:hypothetical protein [Thermoleophilia bacterium]
MRQRKPRNTAILSAFAAVLVFVLLAALPAAAAPGPRKKTLTVAHGPVILPYIDAAPAGPSVGDLRTVWTALTRPGKTEEIGYLSGSLLTVAEEKPGPDQELRTSNLVFVVGSPVNQIVVGGIVAYNRTAPTVATKSLTVRPIVGGSGAFDGARGSCRTIFYPNGTWTHTFTLFID